MRCNVLDLNQIQNRLKPVKSYSAKTVYYLNQTQEMLDLALQEYEINLPKKPIISAMLPRYVELTATATDFSETKLRTLLQLLSYHELTQQSEKYNETANDLLAACIAQNEIMPGYDLIVNEFLISLIKHNAHDQVKALAAHVMQLTEAAMLQPLAPEKIAYAIELCLSIIPMMAKYGNNVKVLIAKTLDTITDVIIKNLNKYQDENIKLQFYKISLKLLALCHVYTDKEAKYALKIAKSLEIKKYQLYLAKIKAMTYLPFIRSIDAMIRSKIEKLNRKTELIDNISLKKQIKMYLTTKQGSSNIDENAFKQAYYIINEIKKTRTVENNALIDDHYLSTLLEQRSQPKLGDIIEKANFRYQSYLSHAILQVEQYYQPGCDYQSLQEMKNFIYQLQHQNYLSQPELIKNGHLKKIAIEYYEKFFKDIEISLLRKKLEYYNGSDDKERMHQVMYRLIVLLEIPYHEKIHLFSFNTIRRLIDNKIAKEKIAINMQVTSKENSKIDAYLGLIEKFNQQVFQRQTNKALQSSKLVVQYILKNKAVNDDECQYDPNELAANLSGEKYDITAMTLWQQIRVAQDKAAIDKLQILLAELLQISPKQFKISRYLGWLPFLNSTNKLLRHELIKQNIVISNYNWYYYKVNKTSRQLLDYYRHLNQHAGQSKEKLIDTQSSLKMTNLLLFHIQNYHHFDRLNQAKVTDPNLQKIVNSFKCNNKNYRQIYHDTRHIFNVNIDSAFSQFKSKIADKTFDEDFVCILEYFEKIGGASYLRKLFHQYFGKSANQIKNHEVALNEFLKFTIECVLEVQATDFEKYHFEISDARLFTTLNHVKKAINRWSQNNQLNYAVRKVPAHKKLFLQCQDLVSQLPRSEYKSYYENYLATHFNDNMAAFHLKKLEDFYQALQKVFKDNMIPMKEKRLWFEIAAQEKLSSQKIRLRRNKKMNKYISAGIVGVLSLGQACITVFILSPAVMILGPLAMPACIGIFILSLFATYIFFYPPAMKLLKSLFVFRHWCSGYKSVSGKILVLGILAPLALLSSLAISILCMMTMMSILTSVLSFPLALTIPIMVLLTLCTCTGFFLFLYSALLSINSKICKLISRYIPDVEKEGWGVKGLITGLKKGLKRCHYAIITPGVLSLKGGYISWLKALMINIKNYLQNPTGDKNATISKIRIKQFELITRGLIIAVFAMLGIFLFAITMVVSLTSLFSQINLILTSNAGLTLSSFATRFISVGLVSLVAGLVDAVFNYTGLYVFINKLVDWTFDYTLKPIIHLIFEPLQTVSLLAQWVNKKIIALNQFKKNLSVNPSKTCLLLVKQAFFRAVSMGSTIFYALYCITLVQKTYAISANAVNNTPSSNDLTSTDTRFNKESATNSLNLIEDSDAACLNKIPLLEVKKLKEKKDMKIKSEIEAFKKLNKATIAKHTKATPKMDKLVFQPLRMSM